MADIATLRRRLRNLVNDRPYGYSVSALGFATDITALSSPTLKVAFGGGASSVVTIPTTTTLNTGSAIAAALQTGIRAAGVTANFLLATVTFNVSTGYTVKSGDIGDSAAITITPGDTDDAASLLKLGQAFGGSEYIDPTPRYTDAHLVEVLNFALAAWNGSVSDEQLFVCSLEELTEPILTIVLYYAWMMLLEEDAGQTAFSFKQKLGGDELALNDVHKNILDLLRYLRDRIDEMKDEIGVSQITVGELTRYDREYGMRVPTYIKTRMDYPRFLQLVRVDANTVLIEWQESRFEDFANAQVWIGDPSISPMLDKALLTDPGSHRPNGLVDAAIKKRETSSPIYTTARIDSLASQVWHFVIVFQDTRGNYYWSNEYSLDLTDANAAPVLVVRNNSQPAPGAPDGAVC